ncbi:MAG: hypothetical protein AAF481_08775 [Acidobacteriota bacterium]
MKALPRSRVVVPLVALLIGVFCSTGLLASKTQSDAIDPDLLAGMRARSIGPATMSGRVASVDATAGGETIFVGAATGGVWRSTDYGLTWEPVFDDQPVASIGAVALDPSAPERVWVGTGEGNPRNSTSVGGGIYRSDDGGETWALKGLEATERIHRVIVHPEDPDTVWVAALGRAWGENPERGVFKSTDGGETWEKVLYVDERTGAADLVIDPSNPRKLLAAMWDYRRWPWSFRSGGPGSGLYLSRDGGESWQRLTPEDGLPEGDLGRMGLAFAASNPNVAYALIESSGDLALYRSDDGGKSWAERTTDRQVGNRPFYYADIRVDPADEDRVYSLWSAVSVSDDGGKSFDVLVPFRSVHPDHHEMWIDPENPDLLINGNDGGVAISRDRGKTWRYVNNLPLGQFYHLRVDNDVPYNVYGGMQDNGSWRGPSSVWENAGIRNHHWQEVGFGDGFDTVPMADDSTQGYAMSQEGYLSRWDVETGARKSVRPAPERPDEPLRFNWNAAIALDPFDPAGVYYGSQYVHYSKDRGETWEVISPDLTTDLPEWQKQAEAGGLTPDVTGAENFTSLVALEASPHERGVLWAGSDDGRIHVTRDGGETWNRVDEGASAVPEHTWVPHIAASPHAADTAFIVFDDHRRSNWQPYAYRVSGYGATWARLDTSEVEGYALVIEQDPVAPNLLYLGTEFGLWISLDGGASFFRWRHGVPTVSVMDLVVQPREHDLVLGTHGRSAYILDDVRPLRELSAEVLAKPIHLFAIPDAQQYWVGQTGSSRFAGDNEFRGENRPYGALITFSLADDDLPLPDDERERERLQAKRDAAREAEGMTDEPRGRAPRGERKGKKASKGEEETTGEEEAADDAAAEEKKGGEEPKATLQILAADGSLVRTFETKVTRGINRVAWNLRRNAFESPPRGDGPTWGDYSGPSILPGEYTVVVKHGDHEARGPVRVLADPRFDISPQDRQAKEAMILRAGALQESLTRAIVDIREARGAIERLAGELEAEAKKAERKGEPEDEGKKQAAKDGRKVAKALKDLELTLWYPPESKGIRAGDVPWSILGDAQWLVGSSWDAPTEAQRRYLEQAEAVVEEALAGVEKAVAETVEPYRAKVRDSGYQRIPAIEIAGEKGEER